MSSNQHGKSSSTPNLPATNAGQGARVDAPLSSMDDNAVDSESRLGGQSLLSLRTEPAKVELQPPETLSSQGGRESLPARREPLVFNPLVLNIPVRIPASAAKQNVEKQPQVSGSEKTSSEHRHTDCRPITISRRFSYPDTYQETMWLFDSVGTTREPLCLLDHTADTLCMRRRSETGGCRNWSDDLEEDGTAAALFEVSRNAEAGTRDGRWYRPGEPDLQT